MKLKDNINDSHGFSRLIAKIVGIVSIFFKKTPQELLPLEEKIKSCIEELTCLEHEECESIDATAATFGELLGAVASFGLEGANSTLGYEIGFHLGKWIYVIDACDDFERDKKKSSYNVLRFAFGEELTRGDREMLRQAMYLELDKMSKALELIDFSECRDVEAIIKNVAYDGLIMETKRVLKLGDE